MQLQPLELLASHAPLWARMQPMLAKKSMCQSLLLVGSRHAGMLQFANYLMATLMCQDPTSQPCGHCSACHLIAQGMHPDIQYVKQDSQEKAIKIEQIRDLQQDVYQTPQRGLYRFILITPADKMNIFAANALLKILEEPPAHTLFILLAEQLNSLPPTILSRCQRYIFTSIAPVDYLSLGEMYSDDSARSQLFKQNQLIITGLVDLVAGKISPCTLAAQWAAYAPEDLLWFLYLLNAQLIHAQVVGGQQGSYQIAHLAALISPTRLFKQLDQINALLRKINHTMNMNQTLALENLLLGYLRSSHG